jgi:cobalt/nickel transport system ATP-binding protein
MSAAAIDVRGVRYRYPRAQTDALQALDLHVAAGERVAVLGPNGSGKTTLALHVNGLLALQEGSITIGDVRLEERNLTQIRRRVGLVFQDPDDQLFMPTVAEDVAFGPANLGLDAPERRRRVADALAATGSDHLHDRAPHHLSGGEKRRIAIAGVLAVQPDVLVLDEPTSGLDPFARRELAELLRGLEQTQLIVTHDLPFAHAVCPRAVIIDAGRIVADAPTHVLLADPARLARHRLELPFGFTPPATA